MSRIINAIAKYYTGRLMITEKDVASVCGDILVLDDNDDGNNECRKFRWAANKDFYIVFNFYKNEILYAGNEQENSVSHVIEQMFVTLLSRLVNVKPLEYNGIFPIKARMSDDSLITITDAITIDNKVVYLSEPQGWAEGKRIPFNQYGYSANTLLYNECIMGFEQ